MSVESLDERRMHAEWRARSQSRDPHTRMALLAELHGVASSALGRELVAALSEEAEPLADGPGPPLVFCDGQGELWSDGRRIARFKRSRLLYRLLREIAVHGDSLPRAALYERVWELPWRPPHAVHALHASISRLRGMLDADVVGLVASLDGYRLTPERAVLHWRGERPVGYRPVDLPSRGRVFHHLPEPTCALVGRDDLLVELDRMSERRSGVLCVLGPAGIGKTSLVRAWADVVRRRPGGFAYGWWIDVVAATSAEALVELVASQMGPSTDPDERLRHAGRAVLVLDNVEQLVGELEPLARWTRSNPDLLVVATSRRQLGVSGEVAVSVPPLDVGAARELLDEHDLEDQDAAAIATAVGLNPLALRQVSAQLRRRSPKAILRALHRGGPDVLAASLTRSWELLDAQTRRLTRIWSVLEPPVPMDLAAAAAGVSAREAEQALAALESLHLGSRSEAGFRPYPEVHPWLRTQASADDRQQARDGLHAWARDLPERGASWPAEARWARWSNIDGALRDLVGASPETAARLMLWVGSEARDRLPAAGYLSRLALILNALDDHPNLRARLLGVRSYVHIMAGRPDLARQDVDVALSLVEPGSTDWMYVAYNAAFLDLEREPAKALQRLEPLGSHDLPEDLASRVHVNRGRALSLLGRPAEDAVRRSLALAPQAGPLRDIALVQAARQMFTYGDFDGADAIIRELGADPERPLRLRLIIDDARGTLAWMQARLEDADEIYAGIVDGFRALGAQRSAAFKCLSRAAIRVEMGDAWRGRELLAAVEQVHELPPFVRMVWWCIHGLADLEEGLDGRPAADAAVALAEAHGLQHAEPEWVFGTAGLVAATESGPQAGLQAAARGVAPGDLSKRGVWRIAAIAATFAAAAGDPSWEGRLAELEAARHHLAIDPRVPSWLELVAAAATLPGGGGVVHDRLDALEERFLLPDVDVHARLLMDLLRGWATE